MKTVPLVAILSLVLTSSAFAQDAGTAPALQPYLNVLQNETKEPVAFVNEKLDQYDLLLFDDGLHSSVEPFSFYQALIRNPNFQERVRYVFLEAIPINKQQYIDAYLGADEEDPTILYPAFQDDYTGFGWRAKTYFDLLHTLYTVNHALPEDQRFVVVGVSNPVYWTEIETPEDVALFRESLSGRDYDMYAVILGRLGGFASGEKGVFFTNTRHTYKGIRKKDGSMYWDTGAFFHQWHPGKTYSIRFHNVALQIARRKQVDASTATTAQGLESVSYSWVRMEDGKWDSAFEAMGNRPLAFSLDGNVFGRATYVGNHMLGSADGQTMYDAYDAVIFLKPLEQMHQTAMVSDIYTPAFKNELVRRYHVLYTEQQLQDELSSSGVSTVEDLIEKRSAFVPEAPLQQAQSLTPIDAWKQGQ